MWSLVAPVRACDGRGLTQPPVEENNMETIFDRWWATALRGVAAIIFGILTLAAPGTSLYVLVILFGVYALLDGVLYLVMAARGARQGDRWGSLMLAGVAGIAAGIVTLLWPGVSALALLILIGAWAIVTGVASIAAAVRLRKDITGEWLMALGGALSIVFGVLVVLFPGAGALAVTMWIGIYALVLGVALVALAFRLRSLRTKRTPRSAVPTPA
jgi:uncharacterized membrane protein HdeD (DUF308 family)